MIKRKVLVLRLLDAEYVVRCLARDPRMLDERNWEHVEIVRGDVLDGDSVLRAAQGCSMLFYLVHSRGEGESQFQERDRTAAENTA